VSKKDFDAWIKSQQAAQKASAAPQTASAAVPAPAG